MEVSNDRVNQCIVQLGTQVRAFRRARKWTQAELAERAGLSSVFIGRLERADDGVSVSNLVLIADALEVPVIALLEPWVRETRSPRAVIMEKNEELMMQLDEKDLEWLHELLYFISSRRKKEFPGE